MTLPPKKIEKKLSKNPTIFYTGFSTRFGPFSILANATHRMFEATAMAPGARVGAT